MPEDYSDEGWRKRWENRFSPTARIPSWWGNQRAKPISLAGLSFFAIDETTSDLYWNGQRVQTRTTVRLEGWTFITVAAASIATVGLFLIELVKALGWLHA